MAPLVYITDLTFSGYDPADLFDLAFLLRSPDHDLRAVCLTEDGGGERVVNALSARAKKSAPLSRGADGLAATLRESPDPLNLVVVGGYRAVAEVLEADRALFREKAARLFLVGGFANDYAAAGRAGERLPIDPRLQERNPERFAPGGDPRLGDARPAWGRLLTSGEGVIWLPRDVSLWRYAAPSLLDDGGTVAAFLLRELFAANMSARPDRYEAADAPALLSTLPALLLATQPDPFGWMRLFRAVTARATVDESGALTDLATRTDSPNLYVVVGIDGRTLGQQLTAGLRSRPLAV